MVIRTALAAMSLLATSAILDSQQNTVKGQGQLSGSNAEFGTVYSLKNGFNFSIVSAKYTLDVFDSNFPLTADTGSKLLVVEFAIKNVKPEDNFFATDDLFVAVDTNGKLFPASSYRLESTGNGLVDLTLRPGQGLGQKELKDPLRFAVRVDAKSVINKIMVNLGRLNTSEQVVRYMLEPPAKEGATAKPKNFIAPLAANVVDPADPFGAKMLDVGKGALGTFVPSGTFALRLDSLAADEKATFDGEPAEEGKKFVVATFTVRHDATQESSMFEVEGGDEPLYEITDADGERYRPRGYRKAKADEEAEKSFRKGDTYTYRMFFVLPNDAIAKSFVYGAGMSRKWSVALN